MKKTKIFLVPSFLLLIGLFFISCSDDDDEKIEDYDKVETKHSEDYWNNNIPSTYFILDEVKWLEDDNGNGNSNPTITRDYDNAILSSIASNMNRLGYVAVNTLDESNLPDLIIRASALATNYQDINYIYDVGYNWWGLYNPFFPGGVYPVYYEWEEGTILIEMGNANSLNLEEKKVDIIWVAGINGLVRGSQSANISFINTKIRSAFDMSTYLNK